MIGEKFQKVRFYVCSYGVCLFMSITITGNTRIDKYYFSFALLLAALKSPDIEIVATYRTDRMFFQTTGEAKEKRKENIENILSTSSGSAEVS